MRRGLIQVTIPMLWLGMFSGCSQPEVAMSQTSKSKGATGAAEPSEIRQAATTLETATFGGGCFWCIEAVFEEVKGVRSVVSGYAGGSVEKPSYEQVCDGSTGHAEVCRIEFDPAIVSYDKLLEIFWTVHDPTTLNRQGNDVGTQYRSVIFYHSEAQREKAESYKQKLADSGAWDRPILTEIAAAPKFFPAEEYHQGYFAQNPNQGYCSYVIRPKMDKFRKVFSDQLK